jgi:hypothetical protein
MFFYRLCTILRTGSTLPFFRVYKVGLTTIPLLAWLLRLSRSAPLTFMLFCFIVHSYYFLLPEALDCFISQATTSEYRAYQEQVISNSAKFAEVFVVVLLYKYILEDQS